MNDLIERSRWFLLCIIFVILNTASYAEESSRRILVPEIDGDWWKIAGNPDLGKYTSKRQQPVDFAIWQAADGTWQLWSCIRHTRCGGKTRLLYRWEGRQLTDRDWKPIGIAMEANPQLGETRGGLQAPHVIKVGKTYCMFYGDWNRICLTKSEDGKEFKRVLNQKGQPNLFSGPGGNTRDPMVLLIGNTYYCYYTGHFSRNSQERHRCAVFCRTSPDLLNWSEPIKVIAGGSPEGTTWFGGDSECPFVVEIDRLFYLFRNQRYGKNSLNTQYYSLNPFDFGVGHDRNMIGKLQVAAPEIIRHRGGYYIAALLPDLKGIRIARLKWIKKQSD